MPSSKARTLILASASPRRRKLLKNLGLTFKVIPADVDESKLDWSNPEEVVKGLAFKKASDVAAKIDYSALIIGSDTTVVINNKSLGKPEDEKDAFEMLKLLSGKTHHVITGIAIIDNTSQETVIDSVSTEVIFKDLSDEEINNYIKTGEPMDKAGAYAIQGLAGTFVIGINGCYSNIVGLPIQKLTEILNGFQVNVLSLNVKKS